MSAAAASTHRQAQGTARLERIWSSAEASLPGLVFFSMTFIAGGIHIALVPDLVTKGKGRRWFNREGENQQAVRPLDKWRVVSGAFIRRSLNIH
jgi:hypothetical protein